MNTPNWMIYATVHASRHAKTVRRRDRRSTDHRLDVVMAFGAMVVSMWCIYAVTSLMLH